MVLKSRGGDEVRNWTYDSNQSRSSVPRNSAKARHASQLLVKWKVHPVKPPPLIFRVVPPPFAHCTSFTGVRMASRPELKEEDESSFCKFFRNLPEKNADTVRIFDRGDYYSAHGEDAKYIAATVSLPLVSLYQSVSNTYTRYTAQQL